MRPTLQYGTGTLRLTGATLQNDTQNPHVYLPILSLLSLYID